MITNFKIFERANYKKNDYILIDVDEIKRNNEEHSVAGDPPDTVAKIIQIDKMNVKKDDNNYPYHVEFIDDQVLQLRSVEILRKLTPSEIVEFEIKQMSNKFNI